MTTEEESPFRIQYLPVNMAYVVLFGDSILKGPCPKDEAEQYLADLLRERQG